MSRISFHSQWLCVAVVASMRGTCSRRLTGTVLTDANGRVLSTGYNGPGSGLPHCIETPCRGAEQSEPGPGLCEAIHSEQNALTWCRFPYEIRHVYSTCRPCVACTKMLLGTPATHIWFLEDPHPGDTESERLWTAAGRTWTHHPLPEGLVDHIRAHLFS